MGSCGYSLRVSLLILDRALFGFRLLALCSSIGQGRTKLGPGFAAGLESGPIRLSRESIREAMGILAEPQWQGPVDDS